MHTHDTLGVAVASFTCSANGTCSGTTQATQRAFIDLQTQINRVGIAHGITRLATDGKIGPATTQAMLNLARALHAKLGTNTDPAIEDVIFGVDGRPTTSRELALNAENITDALRRDGATAQQWSVLQTIRDMAQQIIETGAAQPQVPAVSTSTPINPYPTTTVTAPVTPPPATAPDLWTYVPPVPTAASTSLVTRPPTWMIATGIGLLVVIIGVGVAIARGKAA